MLLLFATLSAGGPWPAGLIRLLALGCQVSHPRFPEFLLSMFYFGLGKMQNRDHHKLLISRFYNCSLEKEWHHAIQIPDLGAQRHSVQMLPLMGSFSFNVFKNGTTQGEVCVCVWGGQAIVGGWKEEEAGANERRNR